MIARPIRKSRLETQPRSTTYDRSKGMTTGPPPKITVPARYIFAKRLRDRGGAESLALATRMAMKEAMVSG